MNPSEPPHISPEASIVIPIGESISNGLSALPPAASIAAGSVQRVGGFASTFAAAQGFSREAETAGGEGRMPAGSTAPNADAVMSLIMRSTASNPQVKKLLNRDSVAAGTVPGTNVAAEFIPAAATAISTPLHAALLPAVIAAVQGQGAEVLTGTVLSGSGQSRSSQSGPPTAVYEVATQSAGFNYSAGATTGSAAGSATSAGGLQSPVLSRDEGGVELALPESAGGSQGKGSQNSLVQGQRTELADSTTPLVFAATTQPPTSATIVSQDPGSLWNGNQSDDSVVESAEATAQANQASAGAASGPVLLANADLDAGTQAGLQAAFAGKMNIGQAYSADAAVPDVVPDSVVQSGAQTGTANPLAAIFSGQVAPSTVLNPADAAGPAQVGLQFAAAKVASAITGTGVRAGTGTRPSTPAAVVSTGPGSNGVSTIRSSIGSSMESPIGSQTPFSVFFSSPGPGTESAASALPKLILPQNSAALRDGHGSGAGASSASPQSSGLPGGISQNGASQNIPSPNPNPSSLKDSLNGTASESLQTAQSSRRDADENAASAQLAVAQTGAAQGSAPAPPGSAAAMALPLSGSAAPVNETLPKPEPSPAPAAQAGAMPAAAETLPAAVPGSVQVAQMMNRIGQSEMRIGMNTSAFGNVEVRTVVHANDVGLVIGSEKGDLRTLLANDMPAITNTLQQQNLRLNSVNFMQGFAFSNNASGGGDSRQQSFVPMRGATSAGQSETTVEGSLEVSAAGEFAGSGLSILA